MELIERYLHEVGRRLPPKNRADIQAELRSLLVDTLEQRAGDEPGEDAVVALLKEFGPPRKVAASYWPEGQYLIGPALFPVFRTVCGIALLVLVIVHLVVLIIAWLANPEPWHLLNGLSEFWGNAVSTLGAIVVVFYILQLFEVRFEQHGQDWDPRRLPVVEQEETVNRRGLTFEIALALVLLVALLAFPNYVGVVVTPGTPIIPNPVVNSHIPLIALALLLGLGLDAWLLWKGRWNLQSRAVKLGVDAFGIYVLVVLVSAHAAWLQPRTGGGFFGLIDRLSAGMGSEADVTQIMVVQFTQLALTVALVVVVVEAFAQLYRLVRHMLAAGSQPDLKPPQQTRSNH
ncbi:MAG: hypothetical protein AB1894_27860 [Chloroflexota bacterium]